MNRHQKALELDKILALLANETSCEQARDAALELLPSSNIFEIDAMLNETNDAHMLISRFGAPSFGGYRDINGMLARAEAGAVLSPAELLYVATNLKIFRQFCDWRAHFSSVKTCLDPRMSMITPNKYLEEKISMAILNEDEISDNASHELSSIRRKIGAANNKVRDRLDKLIRSQSYQKYLQDAIITQRNGRFVVPVKHEHRSEIQGLVHDTSSSGATVFIEPMGVVEANNEIRLLRSKEQEEIERILAELSTDCASFKDGTSLSGQMLAELNFIFAKARLAFSMNASLPVVCDDGITDIKKARHPLIDAKKVVPTDISLGKDFDTLIITGPNTGGKTVAIKTLGLLTLMVMCGLMVPAAENSKFSVFEHVLCDIGDEQSIEQSLSTFSSHMVNIIEILKTANRKSLVLIDELGAGTDPVEGAALAMSILEELHLKGAKIGATTHYAELKAYALNTPHIENGSCEFDVATLKPTYRLLIGIPGKSNAFAISEHLGIPQNITNRARELVSTENLRFEEVVAALEAARQQMETEKIKAEKLKEEADLKSKDAGQMLKYLEKDKEAELAKAKEEANKIVYNAKLQYDAFISELEALRKQHKNTNSINKSGLNSKLREMERSADPVAPKSNDGYVLPRKLKVGDTVLIVDIDKKAIVQKESDEKGMTEVLAGILSTRVNINNLRLITAAHKPFSNTRTVRNIQSNAAKDVRIELDLRGQMSDDAIIEVDRFIDSNVLMGIGQITIIHGKGTGALRKAISAHLKHHPSVKSYRLGVFGEGESGVTVVELK